MLKFDIINFTRLNTKGSCKAIFNIAVGGAVTVNGLKLLEKESSLFVGMPSRKQKDDKYSPQAFINDNELYTAITEAAIAAYYKEEKDTTK